MERPRTGEVRKSVWQCCSDEVVAIGARAGDPEAFAELAIRFRPAMLAIAERIVGGDGSAEDVVQEALVLAHRALPTLREAGNLGAWLHAITRHRALRVAAAARSAEERRTEYGMCLACAPTGFATVAESVERRETHEVLHAALRALPPECETVLRLYYWEGMPQRRIADFLAVPLTSVKWRLSKAKQILSKRVHEQEGYDHDN